MHGSTSIRVYFALMLAAGLGFSWLLAGVDRAINATRLQAQVTNQLHLAMSDFEARIKLFERGVRGTRGAVLVGGLDHMSAEEFQVYADSRDPVVEFPGSQGFGFIRRDGTRATVQFIAPEGTNRDLIGRDIDAEPLARVAADYAIRAGLAVMTPPVPRSALGPHGSARFMLLPVFRPHAPHTTPAEREAAAVGWAFAVFDPADVGRQVPLPTDFSVTVRDLDAAPDAGAMLMLGRLTTDRAPTGTARDFAEFFDRRWEFSAAAGPQFEAAINPVRSAHVFWVGAVITVLAAGMVTGAMMVARRRGVMQAQLRLGFEALEAEMEKRTDRLRAVERDLRAITDAMPSMVAYWDRDLVNRFSNRAYAQWFDSKPEDLAGRHLSEVLGEETVGRHRVFIDAVLAGEPVSYERDSVVPPGGVTRSLIVHYMPDLHEGEVRGFYVMLHDITEIKRAQIKIAESEQFLEQAGAVAGVGGFRIDLLSGEQTWTRQTYKIFDMPEGPAPSTEALDQLMDPAVASELWRAIRVAAESGIGYDIEIPARTARHTPIWIRTIGVVEFAGDRPTRVVGAIQNITEQKAAQRSLIESELKFRSLFELSPVGIALNDLATGQFLEFNDSLLGPTGYTREELLTKSYWDLTPEKYRADEAAQIDALRSVSRYGPYEKEYLRKDGSSYSVLLSGIRMPGERGRDVIWSIIQDISQRKAMESQMADAARRDKLTGLANRTLFMERLDAAVSRVKAATQERLGVLFLDFDRFKLVNDTLGHDAGDELLRQIAARLRRLLRVSDLANEAEAGNVVSRFGGDEFLLLINDLKAPEGAVRIAERLLTALEPAYHIQGSEIHSSASIGIVTSDRCALIPEEIIRNADLAMYEAKRAGRGCSVVFNEAMHTRLTRHVKIEADLRRAIGSDEIYLVFQPIVDLADGHMVSVEALVRWSHPNLGDISPAEFIPIAEESGLIVSLGQWVQRAACQALADWRELAPRGAPATISVNLSRAELAQGQRLVDQLSNTLQDTGLPVECLQLEITEREIMRNPEAALELMNKLRSMGVKLAMDDFGTGTSSLGLLRHYPFNTIKIDRAFVDGVADDPGVLAVMHATINLVGNLGMLSLAEGVENAVQVATLQSLGCQYAQGYYFSRPVCDRGADELGKTPVWRARS